MDHDVPVLIVGGGATGLSASILLSRLGVQSLLVDRHPMGPAMPRTNTIGTRSMELFREWGLEPRIRDNSLALQLNDSVSYTLATWETQLRRLDFPMPSEALAVSPTFPAACPQDVLELALLDRAREFHTGAVRFDAHVVSLLPDRGGVRARIRVGSTGEERVIRARYVIAADGAASRVRQLAGIDVLAGDGVVHSLSVLFRADLERLVARRHCAMYTIEHPDIRGTLLPMGRGGRWLLTVPYHPAFEGRFTRGDPGLVERVRVATGVPGLAVEVLDATTDVAVAQVAERFRDGNIFLAGDAACDVSPPSVGALDAGVHDVQNLAWKIAAVIQGWAGPELLDSYEAERRPIAERRVARAAGAQREASALALDLGYGYVSSAVVVDGGAKGGGVMRPSAAAATGHRAPHVWIEHLGYRRTTLDMSGDRMVLFAGPGGRAWRAAAVAAATELCVPLDVVVLDEGALGLRAPSQWSSRFGLEPDGAVLVRPDGHIAWRGAALDRGAPAVLRSVLERVLARNRPQPRRQQGTVYHRAWVRPAVTQRIA